jgi:hypothetical protein
MLARVDVAGPGTVRPGNRPRNFPSLSKNVREKQPWH